MDNFKAETLAQKRERLQLEQSKQAKEEEEKLRKIVEKVANDPFGLEFLKYLYFICNGSSSVLRGSNAGETDIPLTFAALGRKSIYEQIQPLIPDTKILAVMREPLQ